MSDASETVKKSGGPALLAFGAIALVIALALLFKELENFGTDVVGASLPLIAIGGVIVLILLLTIVAMIFSALGLANKDQAMGLPEGSIRAVIALSLIVLFIILAVFLYKNISTGGPVYTIENMSDVERTQFIRDHTTARDIQSVLVKDKDGQPLKNPDNTPKDLYNVSYRSANTASDDFAKQLLVLLGTLMTAVTSFYLGAGTVTSAVTAGQTAARTDAAIPPPTLSDINPKVYSLASGSPIKLEVMGANLNVITRVKIVKAGVELNGTNVSSNATRVTCDIDVSTATQGAWDVVVDGGGSKSFTLPGALTINP
jgi:hypothetical protein